jgi:O-antigen ligase
MNRYISGQGIASLWVRLLIGVMFVMLVDVVGFFDNASHAQAKIIPVAACVGFALFFIVPLYLLRPVKIPGLLVMPILLLIYALPGLITNKFNPDEHPSSLLILILQISLIGFSALAGSFADLKSATPILLRWLYRLSLLFIGISLYFSITGWSQFASIHERILMASFAFTIPFFMGKRRSAIIGLLLNIAIIALDPRTTTLIAVIIMVILAWLLKSQQRKWQARLMIMALFISPVIVVISFSQAQTLNSTFKDATATSDNNGFRTAMLQVGIDTFSKSPIIGSGFTDGGSYPTPITVIALDGSLLTELPLHNDYLEVLAGGGIIGGILFLLSLLGPISSGLRLLLVTQSEERVLLAVLCIASVIGLVTQAINPVLNNPKTGFFISACLSMLSFYAANYRVFGFNENTGETSFSHHSSVDFSHAVAHSVNSRI